MFRDKDGNVVRNEDGTPVGSVDVTELPDQPDADAEVEPENLSKLSKADLVERVAASGYETDGLTKADLVAHLESLQAEEPDPVANLADALEQEG